MTRVCCECGIQYGEKCPLCGGEPVWTGETAGPGFEARLFQCGQGHVWFEGEGGETHGYCDRCLERVLRSA